MDGGARLNLRLFLILRLWRVFLVCLFMELVDKAGRRVVAGETGTECQFGDCRTRARLILDTLDREKRNR